MSEIIKNPSVPLNKVEESCIRKGLEFAVGKAHFVTKEKRENIKVYC